MANYNSLTRREQDVVRLLLQGKSNKMIAFTLDVSIRTVEFHLKNIYIKFGVASRLELVINLANAEFEKQGFSTVAPLETKSYNLSIPNSIMNWGKALKKGLSIIRKETNMHVYLRSKHFGVGAITALGTGLVWILLMMRYGHMEFNEVLPWIAPIVIVLMAIGAVVGFSAWRRGSTMFNLIASSLFGTGLGVIAMIPMTVLVVVPLGKLLASIGIIQRSAISVDAASTLASVGMIVMWLISGSVFGFLLTRLSGKRTPPPHPHMISSSISK